MKLSARQWLLLVAFQLAYGAVVALVTRTYHACEEPSLIAQPHLRAPSTAVGPDSPLAESMRRFDLRRDSQVSETPTVPPGATTLDGLISLGDNYFSARQYEAAATAYGRALELDPDSAELHNNLGLTLHYRGRSAEALATLKAGVAKDPGHQRSWLTLGFVSLQLGDKVQAREALQQAVALAPDSPVGKEAQRLMGPLDK